MGKVYSIFTRPVRTFNIENRAQRVLAREKPIPAPQHPSVEKLKQIADKVSPDFMENHRKKDPKLDDYLKRVFVQSIDPESAQQGKIVSSKPLPQDRSKQDEDINIYELNINAIQGKCLARQIIHFINEYQENPTEDSIEKIAKTNNLDKEVVDNIVSNFRPFQSKEESAKLLEKD